MSVDFRPMTQTPLQRAVKIVGGQSALARELARIMGRPVPQQLVSYWLNAAKAGVPAEYVIPIETATHGEISREALRPDIYPAEPAKGHAA